MKTLLFFAIVGLLFYFGDAETRGIVLLFGVLIPIVIVAENWRK